MWHIPTCLLSVIYYYFEAYYIIHVGIPICFALTAFIASFALSAFSNSPAQNAESARSAENAACIMGRLSYTSREQP